MLQRIAYGALLITFVFGLVVFDARLAHDAPPPTTVIGALFGHGSLIPLALAAIAVFACLELCILLRRAGQRPHVAWATFCCAALVLAPWLSAAGVFGRGPATVDGLYLQLLLLAGGFIGAGIAQFRTDHIESAASDLAATWLVITYAGFLPSFLTLLRCATNMPGHLGAWVILTFVLVCKISDIGAYFTGSAIGRTRLAPRISPKKSVEGALGGVFASCWLAVLFCWLSRSTQTGEDPSSIVTASGRLVALAQELTIGFHKLSYAQAIIFGAVMSVGGQLGDLIESILKRSAGSKDSASIVPGFGGILDMVDSPIAVAPAAWFLLTQLWAVA